MTAPRFKMMGAQHQAGGKSLIVFRDTRTNSPIRRGVQVSTKFWDEFAINMMDIITDARVAREGVPVVGGMW